MSSKFFTNLAESDSDSETSEPEDASVPVRAVQTTNFSFSDEEEDVKRVVRSAKEKRFEELNNVVNSIKNHKKIKDMAKLLTSFEDLTKAFAKAKSSVIDRSENGKIPVFFIRCLSELDDFINSAWEDRKNMNKNNSKSLTTLRQKLRKYNKDFEEQINAYKENPEAAEAEEEVEAVEDEESGSDDDSDSDTDDDIGFVKPSAKPEAAPARKQSVPKEDGDSSDSIDWDSSDDDSSSSDDDYDGNLAAKFLKSKDGGEKASKKRDKKVKEVKAKKEEDGEWTTVEGPGAGAEKPKMFAKDEEINHEVMLKKLVEVLDMRGKKRVGRSDQVEMLTELMTVSKQNNFGPALEIKIMLGIQSAISDFGANNGMKPDIWNKYLENMEVILSILENNADLTLTETVGEDEESFEASPFRVQGCFITWVEKMDEEFVKMLQVCDPHSPEYVDRLRDELRVLNIIKRTQKYLETDSRGSPSDICRVYILLIDYLYYKFESRIVDNKAKFSQNVRPLALLFQNGAQTAAPIESFDESQMTTMEVINRLCKFIYTNDQSDRIRKLAVLCQVYNFALHDFWFEARDLLLMSGLPATILSLKSDIQLQILYNRALVQVGLCAFRHGYIYEAHSSLLDILTKGRVRELLAQGFNNKMVERTAEQAKQEKRAQVPFHKHINVDLVECVYLVSSMLLEIPDVAQNEYSVRKKLISRSFFNQLRKNEEQALVGVPEAMREHVVAASKAMRVGSWKQCLDLIINDKMNAKIWNFFYQSDSVKVMLGQKIREESLRTYLFTYSFTYDSISIEILSEMFDLPCQSVHSLISKMIINEELAASLDEPTKTVVMHRTEPTRVQSQALQLADKINVLLDYNERLWELKMTPLGQYNSGGRYDRGFQNRQGGGRGGGRGGRGGGRGGRGGGRGGFKGQKRGDRQDGDRHHHHNNQNQENNQQNQQNQQPQQQPQQAQENQASAE